MTPKPAINLITLTDPRSPVSEAYRTLCTNLAFSNLDQPLHSLLITSAGPEEGKSTTTANLAVTLASREMNVILVDCDLRRPVQHQIFGLDNERGLTTMFLEETARAEPPLQQVGMDNLRVLPTGPVPPIPSQLLSSRRLGEVIAALTARADMVLFDAPPLMVASDAAMLAPQVDGVLLVVSAGRTRRDHLRRARQRLAQVQANLLGVILNNVPLDASLQRYYGA